MQLLLLKRGGQTIYAGELGHESKHLVEYFESVPGVPKIPEDYNFEGAPVEYNTWLVFRRVVP